MDAPNLRLHALVYRQRIVAATLVALEGNLSPETCQHVFWGYERLRGNALPETLISHSGRPGAGRLNIVRSIRIAVHPALRRLGLASQLVTAVHDSYEPDLFGTLFGVTPELLRFRRSVGYELVRVGASRGSRTGEPTAVMLYPVSAPAHRLLQELRGDLARDLPIQLELQAADSPLPLEPSLKAGLLAHLPDPAIQDDVQRALSIAAFAYGPRTLESVITALHSFVTTYESELENMSETERTLIRERILKNRGWVDVMDRAHFPTLPAAMRAARRAVRALVDRVAPELKALKPPR